MFIGDSDRLREFLWHGFTAIDLAEPLLSFDADADCTAVVGHMAASGTRVAGVRNGGRIAGYISAGEQEPGPCSAAMRPIEPQRVLAASAPLIEVVKRVDDLGDCFVSTLGQVVATIGQGDFDKPPARMWLFGMITVVEMKLVLAIQARFPGEGWENIVPPARLEKARALQAEKSRRCEHPVDLLTCLQLADKGQIFMKDPALRSLTNHESKSAGDRAFRALEALRNDLAHAQPLVPQHWRTIAALARQVDRTLDFMKADAAATGEIGQAMRDGRDSPVADSAPA